MKLEEIINKAIEGGYEPQYRIELIKRTKRLPPKEKIFIDPSFWKCLGKAMGWVEDDMPLEYHQESGYHWAKGWNGMWHKFIDHLAEGGIAEEFFKELK